MKYVKFLCVLYNFFLILQDTKDCQSNDEGDILNYWDNAKVKDEDENKPVSNVEHMGINKAKCE